MQSTSVAGPGRDERKHSKMEIEQQPVCPFLSSEPETQGEKALVAARLRAGTVQKGLRPAFSGAAHPRRPGEE